MNASILHRETLRYGPGTEQYIELSRFSEAKNVHGIAVLVHGGYWRSNLSASLMDALQDSLLASNWVVANVEYRRGVTSPWPAPIEDYRMALARIAEIKQVLSIQGPTISVGHSVGGQLALLAASDVDAVVALAPVTDSVRTYAEGLGENAAFEYFKTSPGESPEIYRQASALMQLPIATKTLVVHGINDARVPIGHSRDYVGAAQALRSPIQLHEYDHLSHLEEIDPSAVHWREVLSWISDVPTSAQLPSKTQS